MSIELRPEETLEKLEQPIAAADYIAGIETYLADAEKDQVLKPHQDVIFHDIQGFFREGGSKGYVTAPTGTGKTVIFVELSKALLEAGKTAGRTPKILVVEPTKDLVHQTLGRTGQKGYGKFAKELQVSSFFSDSTADDRRHLNKADVVVTTYDSLSIMTRREEVRDQTEAEKNQQLQATLADLVSTDGETKPNLFEQLEKLDGAIRSMGQVATGRTLFDFFDVIIFDEAHHILGESAANIVDSIGKEKVVMGFTATPDANEKKRLDEHLPIKIHDLTFKEAIAMELLAPVASIGLRSQSKIRGSNLFDKEGDYQEGSLSYLAGSKSRNQLITNAAQILVEHGFGTLIPCIPGQGALHARILADELIGMGVSAAAIHGGVPTLQRNRLYRQFEAGQIDVLTNIRILGEGWDSTRAKAIVEASPTRSIISKRQRIGRIVRPGDVAVVVDILDQYDRMNPPLHLADILDGKDLETGEVYGNVTNEQLERIASLVDALGRSAVLAETTPADYSRLFDTLAEYQQIVGGSIRAHKKGHYLITDKISPKYKGVNDEVMNRLWEMKNLEPDVVLGRQNFTIRLLYNVGESTQLLREIPESEVDRAYIEKGERWLSAEGFVIGFSKKYPDLEADDIEERLKELGDTVTWRPLKRPLPKTTQTNLAEFEIFKAYRADEETIAALSKQLEDYFEIVG